MIVIRSFWQRPSVRFLVCGGLAALVNWAVRFPLSKVMPFSAAVLVALIIGMCAGFLLYRTFVWNRSHRSLSAQIGMFIAVNSVNALGILAISSLLILALRHTSLHPELAEATAHAIGIAAGAVANFFGHSRLTFGGVKPVTPYG